MNCPCQSGLGYDACCGRFISQQAVPENAEQLMRSRYCAYVMKNSEYLKATWHQNFRPPEVKPEHNLKWLGLEVIASSEQGENASVEFEARLLHDGRVDALHEKSRFVRENGRWWYTEGDLAEATFTAWKPGRNQVCPCGSGKKFKRCCGRG